MVRIRLIECVANLWLKYGGYYIETKLFSADLSVIISDSEKPRLSARAIVWRACPGGTGACGSHSSMKPNGQRMTAVRAKPDHQGV